MSNPADQNMTPIASVDDLVAILARGCKPREAWRIGTEHEKFGFVRPEAATGTHHAWSSPPWEPNGISALIGVCSGKTEAHGCRSKIMDM